MKEINGVPRHQDQQDNLGAGFEVAKGELDHCARV